MKKKYTIWICGDTHIVALLPLSSSPPDSTATLSLSYPSISITRLHSQLQTKHSFPSRHLNFILIATPTKSVN